MYTQGHKCIMDTFLPGDSCHVAIKRQTNILLCDSRKISASGNRKRMLNSPSAFNGVMVVVEVGASARKLGHDKPHSKKFAPYKSPRLLLKRIRLAWVTKKKRVSQSERRFPSPEKETSPRNWAAFATCRANRHFFGKFRVSWRAMRIKYHWTLAASGATKNWNHMNEQLWVLTVLEPLCFSEHSALYFGHHCWTLLP